MIGTVTEPVYDTATGKFLLIPQGSRILGRYNSQVSYGQSRVQVVWNRIILPDTSSLTLDNLVGTDPAGYAGLEDDVDWHWNRIFAGAVLTTLLGVGAELAAPENRQDGNRIVIAGALVTGIKSDLPGDVIATVTEPVFDTATGKFLLIPQGARILGRYNSQVSYGQSRVQVVWNRIILPDTSSLTLDNLVGTDPAGYAGLEDDVNWHWNRIVAGAVLTTLLGVGAELAAPENRQDGNRIVIAGRDSAQDSINQVGQEITRRNMNIQPTLTTRPGLPVRIIVNRDLVLRPYQPMFFQRGAMQ